jgi:hypothetical protein
VRIRENEILIEEYVISERKHRSMFLVGMGEPKMNYEVFLGESLYQLVSISHLIFVINTLSP